MEGASEMADKVLYIDLKWVELFILFQVCKIDKFLRPL